MCDRPSIDQQITFLYTQDLAASASFYEDKLGFHLWLDQETCRIYTVTGSGYLGLCQEDGTLATKTNNKKPGVIFTLVTQQVDEWYEYLQQQGVKFAKPPTFNEKYKIYHCFLRDPNGYLIEIQRFESPTITSE